MGKHFGAHTLVSVTPTISTSIYASGDQVGGIQTLAGVFRNIENGFAGAMLKSIVITDADNQKKAMDILFFDALPTVASSDNAAIDITAAQLASACIGGVSIAATDYITVKAATNAIAEVNLEKTMKSAVTGASSIYAVIIIRDTPTYAATTSLKFKYLFAHD